MIFNLWKKFKEPLAKSENKDLRDSESMTDTPTIIAPPLETQEPSSDLEKMEIIAHAFQQNEVETLERDKVLANLRALKELVDQPKENAPEMRFSKIMQFLNEPECHETFRQERWPTDIHCPSCHSTNLKRVAGLPTHKAYNHRYHCLECDTIFNDDSGTAMEQGLPPLNIWMHCWYLMGCTESLSYIAKKLGLDLAMIEFMALQLQKTFRAKQPLTRSMGFTEWSKQSQQLRHQLTEDLLHEYERLNANTATAPKDTAEHRRQLILRRELKPSITPPTGGGRKR
jgi:transposase-like protein